MKNRIMTLLLSVAVAFPAFAQQTQPAESGNQMTAASQGETATGKPPLKNESHDFWDGDEPGLGWLVLHPFASKKYVQRHIQPVQDRVTELDELTSANTKMVRDVDSRAQQGIQLASSKANMADQHAMDAASKAEMANQAATTVNTHVATVETEIGKVDQYNSAAQTEIRFRPGQSVLSKQAKEALDQLAAQLKDQHGYIIEVQGFSSGQGQAAIANSQKMATAVERYLVLNQEIPAFRIYVIGLGNTGASKASGRTRVEVSVLKNGLEQAAK